MASVRVLRIAAAKLEKERVEALAEAARNGNSAAS